LLGSRAASRAVLPSAADFEEDFAVGWDGAIAVIVCEVEVMDEFVLDAFAMTESLVLCY